MTDVDSMLRNLADAGRSGSHPGAAARIDVCARVMETLSQHSGVHPSPTLRSDLTPVVFLAAALITAAVATIAATPSWMALLEPWASYLFL